MHTIESNDKSRADGQFDVKFDCTVNSRIYIEVSTVKFDNAVDCIVAKFKTYVDSKLGNTIIG